MDCRHLDDLYEIYLLGVLSDEEAGELGSHLERECPYCLARLREAAESVYSYLIMLPRSKPNPRLKAAILRRIKRKV